MQKSRFEQSPHQRPDSADGHEFGHQVFAAGFQVRQDGHSFADPVKIIQREFDPARMRNRQQMQHRVSRTAQRDDDADRILEGPPGHDVQRANALFEHVHHRSARAAAIFLLRLRDRVLCGTVRQAHPERFHRARHSVGGIHPGARAWTRDRAGFDRLKFSVGDFVIGARGDRLEY